MTETNKLPKEVVEKGLRIARQLKVYGCSLNELSAEELLAAAALGWHEARLVRQQVIDYKNNLDGFYPSKMVNQVRTLRLARRSARIPIIFGDDA